MRLITNLVDNQFIYHSMRDIPAREDARPPDGIVARKGFGWIITPGGRAYPRAGQAAITIAMRLITNPVDNQFIYHSMRDIPAREDARPPDGIARRRE